MKRHPFDAFSFAIGLAITTVGIVFATQAGTDNFHTTWVWPFVMVSAGLGVVISGLQQSRQNRTSANTEESPLDSE